MLPNVIVDDHDPNIVYGGPGWTRSGISVEYNNTSTVSSSIGSTITYTFNGRALSVWGTCVKAGSSASYAIDNGAPVLADTGVLAEDQNWQNRFGWSSLEDGNHTIVITTRSGTFSLDFLLVTPSTVPTDGATLMIDDSDPSIDWEPSAQWSALGTFPEFQNTTHDTSVFGSTMRYNFTGNAISVWGTTQSDILNATFVIDNEDPLPWRPNATDTKLFHQLFYTSPSLTMGDHTLTLTVGNNSGAMIIDYFLVETALQPPSSPSSSFSSSNPTATEESSPDSTSSSRITPAEIAGGAVGGAIVLSLLIAIIFYLLRRRSRLRKRQKVPFDDEIPGPIIPFVSERENRMMYQVPSQGNLVPSETGGHGSEGSYFGSSSSMLLEMQPQSAYAEPTSTSLGHTSQALNTNSSNQRPRKGSQPQPLTTPPLRLHTDGGVRLDSDVSGATVEDLPPVYGQYDT